MDAAILLGDLHNAFDTNNKKRKAANDRWVLFEPVVSSLCFTLKPLSSVKYWKQQLVYARCATCS